MITAALGMGRKRANARMTETVTVGVYTDSTDESTGAAVRTLATSRYSGKGRVKYPSQTVNESDGPGGPVSSQTPFLSIPSGSAECFEGDEVAVTASTADALLVGRKYRVTGVAVTGQTTAHRYPLEELT